MTARKHQIVRDYVSEARGEKAQVDARRLLRTRELGRQPMKPGGRYGREDQVAFRAWMRLRLDEGDARRIEEAQRRVSRPGRRWGYSQLVRGALRAALSSQARDRWA